MWANEEKETLGEQMAVSSDYCDSNNDYNEII
jgi:hypothetical protein